MLKNPSNTLLSLVFKLFELFKRYSYLFILVSCGRKIFKHDKKSFEKLKNDIFAI